MIAEVFRAIGEWRIWLPRTMDEARNIGAGSLFIVLLVSAFAGAVTALQTGYQFQGNLPYYVVGTLVVESIVLELGPVLTALVLAGRIGARYAAELGTMRVTEQIDALESLGRSPMSHLIIPRVLAGLVMIPILTIFANAIGVMAGWWSAKQVLPIGNADFTYGAQMFWRPFDAYFRLVTARRNPCLIILTASALIGRPDWGFLAVTAWTVLTTSICIGAARQAPSPVISSAPPSPKVSATASTCLASRT